MTGHVPCIARTHQWRHTGPLNEVRDSAPGGRGCWCCCRPRHSCARASRRSPPPTPATRAFRSVRRPSACRPLAYVQDIKPIFDRDCRRLPRRPRDAGATTRCAPTPTSIAGQRARRREQLGRRRLLAGRQHVSLLHRRRGDRRRRWCSAGWSSTTRCRAARNRADAIHARRSRSSPPLPFSLVAARNWAQNNEMNVQFHGFQDVRGVTVLSPTVDLDAGLHRAHEPARQLRPRRDFGRVGFLRALPPTTA